MKSKTGPAIVTAFTTLIALLRSRGLKPQLQRLDNEASALLRQFLVAEKTDFQLAPPHIHRRNAAERAIRTFRNHFVAILSGVDPDFPLNLWDRLLDQTQTALNLLRASRINPRLSAQAQLNGAFDFNRTPIVPLGTKIVIHNTPSIRESWAPHGAPAWYVGPATDHYRCYRAHVIETNAERIAETLAWFPKHTPMPKSSFTDAAIAALTDFIAAVRNPAPAAPFAGLDPEKLAALDTLATIFSTRNDHETASA